MKTLYNAISIQLKNVGDLKWIDFDTGQLDYHNAMAKEPDRPPVAFPCALITIEITNCKSITDTHQTCDARITIRLAFNNTPGRSSSAAPEEAQNLALKPYDVIADVYACLQGFGTENFDTLNRASQQREKRQDGLFVYSIVFNCKFEDETASNTL